MTQERVDDQPNIDPEQVWDQLSDEQRARALGLLTEIALKYVHAQSSREEGDARESACEHSEDTPI
jgi:hypothetical protein